MMLRFLKNISALKNDLGEMHKESTLCYLFLQSVQIGKRKIALIETFTLIYPLKK